MLPTKILNDPAFICSPPNTSLGAPTPSGSLCGLLSSQTFSIWCFKSLLEWLVNTWPVAFHNNRTLVTTRPYGHTRCAGVQPSWPLMVRITPSKLIPNPTMICLVLTVQCCQAGHRRQADPGLAGLGREQVGLVVCCRPASTSLNVHLTTTWH